MILDDEATARDHLKRLLDNFSQQIRVIGEAETLQQGVDLIAQLKPSVVFLDVEMPPALGFDLLRSYPKPDFSIVFTTAHAEYAIQAIRSSAVDYLLKPID
ncbi:MAG: response regulator, partial [Bacteroidota bacterium]